MINIKLVTFALAVLSGYIISALARIDCNRVKASKPYYVYFEHHYKRTNDYYRENGRWISLYNYYERKKETKIIDSVKLACDITDIILRNNFSRSYLSTHPEFEISSVNNKLWAIYEIPNKELLLLIQKRDCKVLYIAKK